MTINEQISKLIGASVQIAKEHPSIINIRHLIADIPYKDLVRFSEEHDTRLHQEGKRFHVIYCPVVNGKIFMDIWIYSKPVTIKPQEITED